MIDSTLYYVCSCCRRFENATSHTTRHMKRDPQITFSYYPQKLPATIEFGWGEHAPFCTAPSQQISSHARPTRIRLCGTFAYSLKLCYVFVLYNSTPDLYNIRYDRNEKNIINNLDHILLAIQPTKEKLKLFLKIQNYSSR